MKYLSPIFAVAPRAFLRIPGISVRRFSRPDSIVAKQWDGPCFFHRVREPYVLSTWKITNYGLPKIAGKGRLQSIKLFP
jgi:hypothetical protein